MNRQTLQVLNTYLQGFFPGGVIAGGVVRDLMAAVEQKDCDVFVPHMGEYRHSKLVNFARTFEGELRQEPFHYICDEVESVWEITSKFFDVPVQIIEMAAGYNPMERVRLMDFGICQFWIDPSDGGVSGTQAAWDDLHLERFTLLYPENASERARSMRRWNRLSQKYPGYELVEKVQHD